VTYYGYNVRFHFTFACGCQTKVGPVLEKWAYQAAGLGAEQRCTEHGAPEARRIVRTLDGPHGEIALGWWKCDDGTKIFLTWEPASHWVRAYNKTEGRYPVDWEETLVVEIRDEERIWRLVGGGSLGGDRPEPASEILGRFGVEGSSRAGRDSGSER
jgi:hypothetical protein